MTMRSPAAAVAWRFRRKHRWGLAAVALYLLALPIVRLVIGAPGFPGGMNDDVKFALAMTVPLSAAFYYLLAVFSFGFAGDLAGRQSVYPARMFTLPASSAALAGWPMLYGGLAMAAVWIVARMFGFWPDWASVPVVWPATMLAVFLAWTQVLVWTSYGLRGIRVLAIVLWLSTLAIVGELAIFYEVREWVMLAILAPQLPLAFLAAWSAVARARRGDVRDWRGLFATLRQLLTRRHRRRGFASPARAQAWLEWERHGRSLPALVAIPLAFELALLFLARGAPALIFTILVIALLTPPFMAAFVAASVRKATPDDGEHLGFTPFMATRPMGSAALVGAELTMALRSTLVTWLLMLVAIPLALYASGTGRDVIALARRVHVAFGAPRAVTLALLVGSGLLATTWKQLVQSLYIGLSGRQWAIKGSAFLALALITVMAPLAVWLSEDVDALIAFLGALPWILAILVVLKLSTAAWTATRLHGLQLIRDRTLVAGAAGWTVVVFALHGLLVWIVGTPFIASYVLLLLAILFTPLARLSAAPLALAWNRHR